MTPLVLTMGDPAGIGPEIIAAAWQTLRDRIPVYLVGAAEVMEQSGIPIQHIAEAGPITPDRLSVIDTPLKSPAKQGQPARENAEAVIEMITRAVRLCQSGSAAGMVTAPISKQILIEGAGFPHPGHTEFLAALDGRDRSVMMLACDALKTVPVTIHIPLSDVPTALTRTALEETLRITATAMHDQFGLSAPRIAVAGLNPHAGEAGLMGREEIETITPVLEQLRAEGMKLAGPLPADTMFHAAARETYDVAVTMYHDQGLIPVKALGFETGVNVTLGLSFIRTSPDHGTAFGIAGQGKADATSMIAAIEMAAEMAATRRD